ncbi:MAG: hypothetical protein LBU50_05450 [Cellulomonas sp.]|jgi:hypothetical protein|nr:hypothetical protein [Cellulomonas sp.]
MKTYLTSIRTYLIGRRLSARDAGYGTVEYMLILLGVIVVAGLVVLALNGKISELIAEL